MTKDGHTFVTTAGVTISQVWIVSGADLSQSQQVTSESLPTIRIAEAFDGKLLVLSADWAVWMMHTDGSQRFRFTDVQPAGELTTCGHFVILTIFQKDSLALIRFDKDGSHPTVLARGNVASAACSTDGAFVFYYTGDQPQQIWKVPVIGGDPPGHRPHEIVCAVLDP